MSSNIDLKVNGFRAINSADIHLNGITVLAGINGSGKSTVSKILYHAFELTNHLEDTFTNRFQQSLLSVIEIYQQLKNTYPQLEPVHAFVGSLYATDNLEGTKRILDKAFALLQQSQQEKKDIDKTKRLIQIIRYNLKLSEGQEVDAQSVLKEIKRLKDELQFNIGYRPIKELDKELSARFKVESLLDKISISEYGVLFFGRQVDSVPILHYIKDATYIESPLRIDFSVSSYGESISDSDLLFKRIKAEDVKDFNKDVYHYISKEIIRGEAYNSEDIDELFFARDDGQNFPLQQCATGVKSFAILQLLLRNGYINDRSLIILDEPEAHLHPQWIIEYAKVIVEMNKQIGSKFFITTHSTDLVSALRYISEKEGNQKNICFYNAKPADNCPYRYDYENLGLNIEPIFESFNKSFELLEKYGAETPAL